MNGKRETLAHAAAATLLFLVAIYFRMDGLWLVQLKGDQAAATNRALLIVEGQSVPLIGGPSNAGIANPPGFDYLISLPLRIWPHPLSASAFLALLGSLAVPACYLLGKRHFGTAAGFVAGMLLAVNPWAIFFTREIWEPDSLQLFVVLYALALFGFVRTGSQRILGLAIVAMAFLVQLHFSTVPLLPLLLVALLVRRHAVRIRTIAVAILVSAALYAPYFFGSGLPTLDLLLSQPGASGIIGLESLAKSKELISGFAYFFPSDLAPGSLLATAIVLVLEWGEPLLFATGIGAVVWSALRGTAEQRWAYRLLLLWLALPVLVTIRHPNALYVHYFLPLLPAVTLTAGCGVLALYSLTGAVVRRKLADRGFCAPASGQATRAAPPGGRTAVKRSAVGKVPLAVTLALGVVVLALGFSQTYAERSFFDRIRSGDRERYGYGVPLGYTSQLANYLKEERYREVRLLASTGEIAGALGVLLRGTTVYAIDSKTALPLPPPQGAVYAVLADGAPAAELLKRNASQWRVRQIDEAGRPLYSVYRIPGSLTDALRGGFADSGAQFANGLRLLGTALPRTVKAGGSAQLAVLWRVERAPVRGDAAYVSFAHLVDAAGNDLAGAQEYGHEPATSNLGGDWVSWLEVPAPAVLRSGAY